MKQHQEKSDHFFSFLVRIHQTEAEEVRLAVMMGHQALMLMAAMPYKV